MRLKNFLLGSSAVRQALRIFPSFLSPKIPQIQRVSLLVYFQATKGPNPLQMVVSMI